MKEKVVEYGDMKFYPLEGLDGYYGSVTGRILSTRRGYPILLKPADGQGYSYRAYVGGKAIIFSPAKISFMVKKRCSLESLKGYVFTFIDGEPVAIDRCYQSRLLKEKKVSKNTTPAREQLDEIRNTIDMLIEYVNTGDIKPFACKLESLREFFICYAKRYSRMRLPTATEIANASIMETLHQIAKGKVIYALKDYVMEIIRRKTKMLKQERKKLFGLRDNMEACDYYDF